MYKYIMWLKNYFNELKAWSIMRKVYKENKAEFDKVGLKSDWFGRLWKVINREPKITLGSEEDAILLTKEQNEISEVLIKTNVIDMLAYELIPWNLSRQYVTMKSTILLILSSLLILGGIIFSVVKWLI